MFALFKKHYFKEVFERIHYDVSNIYNMYKIVVCHMENDMSTTFLQQILNNRLLLVIIVRAKK